MPTAASANGRYALASVETLFRVPAGAFSPPPSVDSAVVRIMPRANPAVTPDEEERFRLLVQQAFGMRRKQMRRVLRSVLSVPAARAEELLAVAEIEPEARPETLGPERFAAAWAEGQAMTLEQAIAYALGEDISSADA